MDRVSKLMVFLIVAVTLPVLLVAAPPAKTQECTIDGDIESNGVVELGISVSTWVLTDEFGLSGLELGGDLLNDLSGGPYLPTGYYKGHARVLKKDGRFDFEFGPLLQDGSVCESVTYEDLPPPFGPGTSKPDLCPYMLTIQDGLYDRTADEVTFNGESYVGLVDYSSDDGVYHVGDGPVSVTPTAPGIRIVFQTDGYGDETEPETEPEKGALLCEDTFDNDGDGLVDCDDPNCKKWCP